ncbi:MAG TPA: hypothetical protein DCF43_06250 [Pseudomonas sp.]|nr:hypothetical protein [Pseudomonas sp.]
MTMKSCKVCNKQIAKRAKFCPCCGDQAGESFGRSVLYVLVVPFVVIAIVIISMSGADTQSEPEKYTLPIREPKPAYVFVSVPPAKAAEIYGVDEQYRADVAIMMDRMRSQIPSCNKFMDEGLVTWTNRDVVTANPEFISWCGEGRSSERYFFKWTDIVNKADPYQKN